MGLPTAIRLLFRFFWQSAKKSLKIIMGGKCNGSLFPWTTFQCNHNKAVVWLNIFNFTIESFPKIRGFLFKNACRNFFLTSLDTYVLLKVKALFWLVFKNKSILNQRWARHRQLGISKNGLKMGEMSKIQFLRARVLLSLKGAQRFSVFDSSLEVGSSYFLGCQTVKILCLRVC